MVLICNNCGQPILVDEVIVLATEYTFLGEVFHTTEQSTRPYRFHKRCFEDIRVVALPVDPAHIVEAVNG